VAIFRSNEAPPAWCELRAFDILDLTLNETVDQTRRAPKERLVGTGGTVQISFDDRSIVLKETQFFDLPGERWRLRACSPRAQLVRLSGKWGNDVGSCGIFRAANQDQPRDGGDPVAYRKITSIDRHYHDCDEYWIVLEGAGTVVLDDRHAAVGVGDCFAIGMGHPHDLPEVSAPVKAVFFETTLEDRKRVGHLWNHAHGPAQPKPERA
jgi:mannose-6-phosphate isomerase-like protein (cupin superfamily)